MDVDIPPVPPYEIVESYHIEYGNHPQIASNLTLISPYNLISMSPESFANSLRSIVAQGLAKIPIAGFFLSALEQLLWPVSGQDIWGMIKDQVEALVNEKIAKFQYELVKEDLQGLQRVINDYKDSLKFAKENPEFVREKYLIAIGFFQDQLPHFIAEGQELPLLGLYASFANLHLATLRDGVLFGKEWGWQPDLVKAQHDKLVEAIKEHTEWVSKWYKKGLEETKQGLPTTGNNLTTNRWAIVNRYERNMTLNILDLQFYWPYFDPEVAPPGKKDAIPTLTRMIYSDPIGTFEDNGIPDLTPVMDLLVALGLRGFANLDAIQETFIDKTGGIYTTPWIGGTGGELNPPWGWSGHFDGNLIVGVRGHSGDIINSIILEFKDGSSTPRVGNNEGPIYGNAFHYTYPGHLMTKMFANGPSRYYDSLEGIILGFRPEEAYKGFPR
ncbi:insecticidal delta-endotoxin Cry8Ea1 family protein [uncultured Endozoicomonas sp.]|uniref:insecticidal delta-endotoxin Cry8Ea1 family protein n=1 Tax=uncultured Endozoicomonas sp. TaxID=432652 RepID=UPI002621C425|nr:insecticidal delta-endotoxin Cry8Ea1 family protein [uncultured Endozoicomonas sp.]